MNARLSPHQIGAERADNIGHKMRNAPSLCLHQLLEEQMDFLNVSANRLTVPVSVADGISRLLDAGIIDPQRYSDGLDSLEQALTLGRVRGLTRCLVSGLRSDSLETLVATASALAALLQLTQHGWADQTEISDAAAALYQLHVHDLSLSDQIKSAKDEYLTGRLSMSGQFEDPIPRRRDILVALGLLGVSARADALAREEYKQFAWRNAQ